MLLCFLDLLGYYITVAWTEKAFSKCNAIGHPCTSLFVMHKCMLLYISFFNFGLKIFLCPWNHKDLEANNLKLSTKYSLLVVVTYLDIQLLLFVVHFSPTIVIAILRKHSHTTWHCMAFKALLYPLVCPCIK